MLAGTIVGATTESPLFVLEKDPHLIAAMEKTQLHLQKSSCGSKRHGSA